MWNRTHLRCFMFTVRTLSYWKRPYCHRGVSAQFPFDVRPISQFYDCRAAFEGDAKCSAGGPLAPTAMFAHPGDLH
jgi:hypothetical protein